MSSHDHEHLPALDSREAVARLARYLRAKGLAPNEATALTDAFEILFGNG